MTRSSTQWESVPWTWLGTASGIGFVVVQFAGFGVGAAARDFERITLDTSSADLAQAVDSPVPTPVWIGGYVEVFAYIAFLVFTACLAAALRQQPGRPSWPASAVLAGGVLAVATSMIGYAAEGAAYLRAGDGVDPAVARALLDVANIAFILVWVALAIFLFAAASSQVLPQVLGIAAAALGFAFAAAFVAPSLPVGEIADLALWLWIIAVCVVLARKTRSSGETLNLDRNENVF